MMNFIKAICITTLLLLSACDQTQKNTITTTGDNLLTLSTVTLTPKAETKRWYFSEQAERGKLLFTNNCSVCHGKNAEATPHWKTPDNNGYYPPPPLNGTAHAWHHPLSVLKHSIEKGGAPVGGQMPAFKGQLSEIDMIDIIAYFQSYWSEDIYQRWLQIEHSSRE